MSTFPRRILAPVIAVLAAGAAALCFTGCSMGFTNFHPGENSGLYHHLFEDVITAYDDPYWLWVRGSISGDLDGNGVVEEEVVVATIQKGGPRRPGPIEKAFLAVCKTKPNGEKQAVARMLLFDSDPIPNSPKPVNDLGIVTDARFTRARAQMVQDKVTLKESVVVYFWSDPTPSSVWYIGFALAEDGSLVKNIEATLYQATPGFLTANLDPAIDASPFGYQLVFGVAAIPPEIFAKLGSPAEAPLWGHVYARDESGLYAQADERFGDHYRQLENAWNQAYLRAIMKELPTHELAWFEYHMGLMSHYTQNRDMTSRFLKKAAANAKDEILVKAVEKAQAFIESADPE